MNATTHNEKELSLASTIEALLFYFAEPVSLKKLSAMTKWDVEAVRDALAQLSEKYSSHESGIALIVHNDEASLVTSAPASKFIEAIAKEELNKELSRASLETLSIVCYKGPLTRADIDYVRGVNSTFILRNLQMRGIVEKLDNPSDSRAAFYAPTMQALQYMGVARREDLPRFAEVQEQLSAFLVERDEEDAPSESPVPAMAAIEDSAEDEAILCDTNNDGVLTAEECEPMNRPHVPMHDSDADLEVDADIAEEDLMAPSYLDDDVEKHLTEDKEKLEQEYNTNI